MYGGILLAIYALGMALPLFALALVWDRLGISGRRWLRLRPLAIGRWSNSWIMVISGILSIGIGVLLLLTDGTAGLGGVLSVGDQFRLEITVSGAASGIPNAVFALIAAAVLAVAVVLYLRSQRTQRASGDFASVSPAARDDEEER
jgi:hypothetical protein